jgi:hypothetical protein
MSTMSRAFKLQVLHISLNAPLGCRFAFYWCIIDCHPDECMTF